MLILAHTDGLRIDLHQFWQRVLQPPRNGDGAANGHVQVRKLQCRQFRCRVHRRARLVDDHALDAQLGMRFEQCGDELVGFPRGRAIANADQLHTIALAEIQQHLRGFRRAVLRRGREDRRVVQHLARLVHHRHLHASAQPRVEANGDLLAGRSGQQQILDVLREHIDGVFFGPLADLGQEVGLQMTLQLDAPRPAHHVQQPRIGRPVLVADIPESGNKRLTGMSLCGVQILDVDIEQQDAFLARAEQGHGAVGRNFFQSFGELEVIAILGTFLFLARHQLGNHLRLLPEELPQLPQQSGVFTELFDQDVPRAVEHCLDIGEAGIGIQEGFGLLLGVALRLGVEQVRQRLNACLAGNLSLGATLGLVRQIEIFELGLGAHCANLPLQFRRQFLLFLDALEDGVTPLFEFAQIVQTLLQLAQLRVIQPPCDFLAIAGDKGHRGAFIEQGNGGFYLGGTGGNLGGNLFVQKMHAFSNL